MRVSTLGRDTHVRRSERHMEVAVALHEAADDEWAAVAYFYAAYHLVKAALLSDPIFDDPEACSRKHRDLNMDDRFTDRHQVRKSRQAGRGWGINDLVLLLYREIVGDYDRLHSASVSVRYRDGLPVGTDLAVFRAAAERIRAAFDAGEIVSS